jgi:predicted permease
LTRNPGITAVIVLSLALGIGANATVMCWVRNIVFRPIPGVQDAGQLVGLLSNQGSGNLSVPDLTDLDRLDRIFSGAIASQISPASLGVDRQYEWVYGQVTTPNFFDVLGVKPILGRTFLPGEGVKPGADPILIIHEDLWQRKFDRDPAIVGKVVTLNRHSFTIIGVTPRAFRGTMTGVACDFWAPVTMLKQVTARDDDLTSRNSRGYHSQARLRAGVSLEEAQAAIAALDSQLAAAYPRTNREARHRVLPLSQMPYGAQSIMGPALRLLLCVCAGVLLLVAANVANLLLAQASSRQRETAIRLATGASRGQLIRQLLVESVLLALLGGVAGVCLASFAVDMLGSFLPQMSLPVALRYELDGVTLAATLGLTVLTGLVFGLVPALQASRPQLYETLKEGGRAGSGGRAHHRLRSLLVVAEVAVALVLLVSAALCVQGLRRAHRVDIGLDPSHVLTAGLQIGMNGYDQARGKAFYRQLQQRLASLPGVQEAALASWFPLGLAGCKGHGVNPEGYVRPPGEDGTYEYALVSPGYFATLRVPLVAGRDFTDQDNETSAPVAILNETMAERFWPGQSPLGRKLRVRGQDCTVVGVAKAGKYNSLREKPWPFFYLPYTQGVPDLDLNLCVRVQGDPAAFAPALQRTVKELDPGVDCWGAMPMTVHTQLVLFPHRMASSLLTLLGAVALIIAAMGVYAVMAYAVSQRTQEIGIRMALGAQARDVLGDVLGRGLLMAALGAAVGVALAVGVTRLLTSFLYGMDPFDPLTFGGVSLGLGGIALLACLLPALRAARVDPLVALRCE